MIGLMSPSHNWTNDTVCHVCNYEYGVNLKHARFDRVADQKIVIQIKNNQWSISYPVIISVVF